MKHLIIVITLLCSGCAGFNPYEDMSKSEMVWQGLHLVDALQTINIHDDPCYFETNPYMVDLVGIDAEPGKVAAWWLGKSFIHAAITREIEESSLPNWFGTVWQAITIVDEVDSVYGNHDIGLRPYPASNRECGL